MSQHHLPYTMALLLAAGGAMGFAKTGSKISLGAGLGLGALYALAGYQLSRGEVLQGNTIGLGTSLVVVTAMGSRAMKTKKFMPAGLVTVLGATAGAYHGYKLYQASK